MSILSKIVDLFRTPTTKEEPEIQSVPVALKTFEDRSALTNTHGIDRPGSAGNPGKPVGHQSFMEGRQGNVSFGHQYSPGYQTTAAQPSINKVAQYLAGKLDPSTLSELELKQYGEVIRKNFDHLEKIVQSFDRIDTAPQPPSKSGIKALSEAIQHGEQTLRTSTFSKEYINDLKQRLPSELSQIPEHLHPKKLKSYYDSGMMSKDDYMQYLDYISRSIDKSIAYFDHINKPR